VNHAYDKPGTYPVKVTVTDKYGKPAQASCKTMVVPDPASNSAQSIAPRLPPSVSLKSNPQEAVPHQPVHLDASDSHDYQGNPCVSYVWDFGDGTPKVTTKEPKIDHVFPKSGTFPVSVIATDKFKQTGEATLNQRVREPDPEAPYAAVHSTPKDPAPSQPVRIDASESVDKNGNPCKNYVFDFGDGSPPVSSPNPVVNHAYDKPGTYPVTVIVTDRYGKKANAALTQRVKDPKKPIGPPFADLASNPKDTYPHEPVNFDASKSHDADKMPCKSFVWEFGDGTPKQRTNEPFTTHKYEKPGQYPVVVEAEDKHGQKATAMVQQRVSPDLPYDGARKLPRGTQPARTGLTQRDDPLNQFRNESPMDKTNPARTGLIERHLPPYAGVRSTPTNAKPNEKVLFDASESQDADGDPPVEYQWNFGDGTPMVKTNKPKVEHAYPKPGSYPVSCTVIDKHGQPAKAGLTQRVQAPNDSGPPYAALHSTPKETAPGQPVYLDASESHDFEGKPCVQFVWDFGDGSPKKTTDVPRTEHPYQKAGTYPVTVVVKDKNGKTANASCSQIVCDEMSENAGLKGINYRNQQHNAPDSTSPAYGSGPSEQMAGNPTKPASTSLNQFGNVPPPKNDPLKPYSAVRSTAPVLTPNQFATIDASDSCDYQGRPCKNYVFDFGDGTPPVESTKPVQAHKYDKPGTYPVTVTCVDREGNKATATLTESVVPPYNAPNGPPSAQLASQPKETKPGQPVHFDASKSCDFKKQPCTKFVWDFGDSSPAQTTTVPTVKHPYKSEGTFPVTVTVTDRYNQTAQASVTQRVADEMTENSALKGKRYKVQQHNAPEKDQYHDGVGPEEKMESNPTDPARAGLVAYYDPIDPYAALRSTPTNAKPKEKVKFDASESQDADGDPPLEYHWNFGDDTPVVKTNKPFIDHAYDQPGSYPAKVTCIDKYGNPAHAHCTQRVQDPAKPTVGPPYAALESQPKETLQHEPVDFDASKSHDAENQPCKQFKWDFGDGTPLQTTPGPKTQHRYERPGTFPVRVVAVDKHGQEADATVSQRVIVMDPYGRNDKDPLAPPVAFLEGRPKTTVPGENVEFDASQSHDMNGNPCVSFEWDFGDGSPKQTTKQPVVNHAYQKMGHFPATVTVADVHGQKAKAHTNTEVTDSDPAKTSRIDSIRPPSAALESQPKETEPNEPVDFDASKSKDMYGKPCASFTWDFGDGTPPVTTKTPTTKHPYKNIGNYPVTVTVKDRNGLTSNASVNQKVDKPNPAKNSAEWDPIDRFANNAPIKKSDPAYAQFIERVDPPFAHLEGNPKVSAPKELVDFDASRSHDFQGGPIEEFTFDFGDGTPKVVQDSPFVKHAYQQMGHYPVSVTVKDKFGLTGVAHCNQKVTDSNPSRNNRIDQIRPPEAHLVSNPPESKPNDAVAFDASASKDMYNQPCASFTWDFGDGSPQPTTKQPTTTHAYKEVGHYPVTVTVKDKNGLTAKASVNQKVSDPIDSYAGNRNIPNPVPEFGRNDPEELKDEPPYSRMDPEELGDEFRGIVGDAASKALMDPNIQNAKKAKKMADVMKRINPQWPDEELDPEAKKRYHRFNHPMKPLGKKPLIKPKIGIKAGKANVNEVDLGMTVDFGGFAGQPDI